MKKETFSLQHLTKQMTKSEYIRQANFWKKNRDLWIDPAEILWNYNSPLALASSRICKRQLAALNFMTKHSKLLSSAFCDFPNLSKKQASAIKRLSKNKALRVFFGGSGKTISTMDYFTPKPKIK